MLEKFETILREKCGLDKARPILAGVSGGPDSLCLLGVLREAGYPVVAAHFNHRLRPEAEAESAYVEAVAARLGIMSVPGGGDGGMRSP
jgi:tRNA(Ile)-lysidine synthase